MRKISFFVPGIPQPGGSKRAFTNPKTGRPVIVEDCKKNRPWRADCKAFASQVHHASPLEGPLSLSVTFFMNRPKGHYGSGRNSSQVKNSAPSYPGTKPDATKLLRALEDALTGILWRDDAQIVTQVVRKRYVHTEQAGAYVEVEAQS